MMSGIFHNAIRATSMDATRNFYTRVLDMVVDDNRPKVTIPGFWLRAALPDSPPTLHIFGEEHAELDGVIPTGGGAVHHLALYCKGYHAMIGKLNRLELSWHAAVHQGARAWQIFVYDPNGIMLELSFDPVVEACPLPQVPADKVFVATEPFKLFEPGRYTQFER